MKQTFFVRTGFAVVGRFFSILDYSNAWKFIYKFLIRLTYFPANFI